MAGEGGVGEVGVYRGKSFLPLYLLLASRGCGEHGEAVAGNDDAPVALAIDCFDQQQWNVDSSGEGDEGEFRRNVRRFAPDGDPQLQRLRVLKGAVSRRLPLHPHDTHENEPAGWHSVISR